MNLLPQEVKDQLLETTQTEKHITLGGDRRQVNKTLQRSVAVSMTGSVAILLIQLFAEIHDSFQILVLEEG